MADIQTTTNPSIGDLCHQWRVVQARINLEVLQATDDDAVDAAVGRGADECEQIIDTIAQTDEAKDLSDVSGMLMVAKKLIRDTSGKSLLNPDHQVVQLLEKAIASTADLKAGYRAGIAEQIQDVISKPDPETDTFNRAWSAYLDAEAAIQKHCAVGEDISDGANDSRQKSFWMLIRTPATRPWMLKRKLLALQMDMEPSGWSDHRDPMMLASIASDVEAMN